MLSTGRMHTAPTKLRGPAVQNRSTVPVISLRKRKCMGDEGLYSPGQHMCVYVCTVSQFWSQSQTPSGEPRSFWTRGPCFGHVWSPPSALSLLGSRKHQGQKGHARRYHSPAQPGPTRKQLLAKTHQGTHTYTRGYLYVTENLHVTGGPVARDPGTRPTGAMANQRIKPHWTGKSRGTKPPVFTCVGAVRSEEPWGNAVACRGNSPVSFSGCLLGSAWIHWSTEEPTSAMHLCLFGFVDCDREGCQAGLGKEAYSGARVPRLAAGNSPGHHRFSPPADRKRALFHVF